MPEVQDKPVNDEESVPDGSLLAAVDLGSNSFHLILARVEHGEIRPVEMLAEKVQLGAGLVQGRLSVEAIERGLGCLARFAQVLESVEPSRIRAVGTNALRIAKNRKEFTLPAGRLLGTRIDVIYGREEARLVYLGVAHTLADDAHSRLVVDIGGGSTEFIVGQRFEPQRLESLQMGCVSYAGKFFSDGKVDKDSFRKAYQKARLETSRIRHQYDAAHWAECVGSSGTLQAIELILQEQGWSEGGITRDGLNQLRRRLLDFKKISRIELLGLTEQRRTVIVPGVAITAALFDELGIDLMRTSPGALREGVIYDLMGRLSHEDVRERTINALMQRYNVETDTAELVENRARTLFSKTRKAWSLKKPDWELLHWAARTHEIGMAISHKHFNRHGAYLLRNADLPGFSQDEQEQLAVLVSGHRRKLDSDLFVEIAEADRAHLLRLLTIMRLATLFKYVERLEQVPEFEVLAAKDSLHLHFPSNWLQQHPLTASELQQETQLLGKAGMTLEIAEDSPG